MLQTTWGWEPALYLFLGGMGAGCFIMAAVLFLIDKKKHRLVTCVSMWAAFACLAAGLVLLGLGLSVARAPETRGLSLAEASRL